MDRILVVEDEEAIRGGLADVLAYHGYAPTAVETGEEGLELGLRQRFALERVPAVVDAVGRRFRITEHAMSGKITAEAAP